MGKRGTFIIFTVFLTLFVVGTSVLYMVVRNSRSILTCEKIEINFKDGKSYVQEDEVRKYLRNEMGDLAGQRLDSLKLYRIEEVVEGRSAVRDCEAWTSSDGVLHLDITQREPVVKFVFSDGSFYADSEGFVFPLGKGQDADVPTIKGALPMIRKRGIAEDEANRRWVRGVLDLQHGLETKKELQGRLESISVRGGGDLCVKLNDCVAVFIIGQPEDLDAKLDGMVLYFKEIAPAKGDKYYKIVNLKYNKQIICRRDI